MTPENETKVTIGKIERRICLNPIGRCLRCGNDIGYGNLEIVVPHVKNEGIGYLFCNDCFMDVPLSDIIRRHVSGQGAERGELRERIREAVKDAQVAYAVSSGGHLDIRLADTITDAILAVLGEDRDG